MFGKKKVIDKLRSTITTLQYGSFLEDVPRQLDEILSIYSKLNVNEEYRRDVFILLQGSISIANTLLHSSYHGPTATKEATSLLRVISRIIFHLQNRAEVQAWAIFDGRAGTLLPGTFPTEEEALTSLSRLQSMGAAKNGSVIPVKVQSDLTFQPILVEKNPTTAPAFSNEGSIPEPENEFTLAQLEQDLASLKGNPA